MYFMQGLDIDAGKFFIYFLFIYTTTFCITALYRMFAALSPTIDDAVRFSGIALNLLIIYTGYVIPKPQLLSKYIWFGWLYYVNVSASDLLNMMRQANVILLACGILFRSRRDQRILGSNNGMFP
jgi:ABC-type multidrug transport system permease subunit